MNSLQLDEERYAYSYAMQIANSCALPMSMHAAIQLEIFDIIAKAGPEAKLSAKEIAAQLPTKNPEAAAMVDRILRLLATHCIVGCTVSGDDEQGNPRRLYSLTTVTKFFVSNADGVSLAPFMNLLQDKVFIESWWQLKDSIIEGGTPFTRAHGMHLFEYPGKDPRFNQVFNTALENQTTICLKKSLDTYKGFETLKRLVDVGGGMGVTLSMITSMYPSIHGINFDLPHVLQHAPPCPGIEHVGGDMFESVPKGDAILMKWILHDWSDKHCLKLLKNCYNALPNGGKVIAIDAVYPIVPETDAVTRNTALLDVLLIAQTEGGKERSKPEFEALATRAGFSGVKFDCFVHNMCVMEFLK